MKNNYDDIINHPRWNPKKHPRMSMESRNAQFAPFAALTGYEDAVKETARLTDRRIEIDEGLKEVINNKLQYVLENGNINPIVEITYFLPDERKKGGKYVEKIGQIKKVDSVEGYIIFKDKVKIRIDDVININGEIFKAEDYE